MIVIFFAWIFSSCALRFLFFEIVHSKQTKENYANFARPRNSSLFWWNHQISRFWRNRVQRVFPYFHSLSCFLRLLRFFSTVRNCTLSTTRWGSLSFAIMKILCRTTKAVQGCAEAARAHAVTKFRILKTRPFSILKDSSCPFRILSRVGTDAAEAIKGRRWKRRKAFGYESSDIPRGRLPRAGELFGGKDEFSDGGDLENSAIVYGSPYRISSPEIRAI